MNRPLPRVLLLAALLALPTLDAQAQTPNLSVQEQAVVTSSAFLKGHQDMHFRLLGLEAIERGKPKAAREYFTLGARYADKVSQAMLAELHWKGQGGPTDRALGYAWMDLAAERGTQWLVVQRENYWEALDEAERRRAVEEGKALYAEYGDPTAKLRQERVMRRTIGEMTGSRTGALGSMTTMQLRFNGQMVRVVPEVFYAPKLWEPTLYWAWQEQEVAAGNIGRTHAGPAQSVPSR